MGGNRQPCATFRLKAERAISEDWFPRHEGRYLQLKPSRRNCWPTRSMALVCEWEDGTIQVTTGERRSPSQR